MPKGVAKDRRCCDSSVTGTWKKLSVISRVLENSSRLHSSGNFINSRYLRRLGLDVLIEMSEICGESHICHKVLFCTLQQWARKTPSVA